ncbi:MAG: hypothetical protein ONB17_05795 [candidate division KSB1 bacterium]|nr:hypothetical protein [candidate division KSB1 bacterium]
MTISNHLRTLCGERNLRLLERLIFGRRGLWTRRKEIAMPTRGSDRTGSRSRTPGKGSRLRRLLEGLRSTAANLALQPHEYQSSRRLLGLPLLSINIGPQEVAGALRHARGIVAIGNKATGVIAIGIFAARGLCAIGFLTVGVAGVSIAGIGLLTVSVFGAGLVSVSAVALGYLAVGVIAVGVRALGVVAIGLDAVGIIAVGKVAKTLFTLGR